MTINPTYHELPVRARRHHVRDWLGVSEQVFTKLVEAGVLVGHKFLGQGRAVFYREEVLAAVERGALTAPAAAERAEIGTTEARRAQRAEGKTRERGMGRRGERAA